MRYRLESGVVLEKVAGHDLLITYGEPGRDRMPYVLVYQNDDQIRAWLTVTLPPYKARSKKSFVLRGEKSGTKTYNDEINFIDMIETNFENIWEHGSVSAKEYMDRRQTAGGEK